MTAERRGADRLTLDDAATRLPVMVAHLDKILARLRAAGLVGEHPRILDVGAAQGQVLLAAARRGLRAVGVEPIEEARQVGAELSGREGAEVDLRAGTAEALPFDDGEFDFVHANSVLEHVSDAQAAMNESARVLRPGGVLWFSAASSVCPHQEEIGGFPLFGWYPDRLKRRIMYWARDQRPHLIGGTSVPAIHWFTPGKARRMLRQAVFDRVLDRWDLRLASEGGRLHAAALRTIRTGGGATKLLADLLVPHCSYAAAKGK